MTKHKATSRHPSSIIHHPQSNRTIGLLGGSFNPAHSGHLHISREALKRLGLDAVWWLITPRNPLKKTSELADYGERVATAKKVASADRRIRVSDLEQKLHTHYTVDTLERLQQRYPHAHFVWLMGADNLANFHRWKRWSRIFSLVPVAVFDRAPYSHNALRSKAASRFAAFRMNDKRLAARLGTGAPGWAYITMRRDPTSATGIRKKLGK